MQYCTNDSTLVVFANFPTIIVLERHTILVIRCRLLKKIIQRSQWLKLWGIVYFASKGVARRGRQVSGGFLFLFFAARRATTQCNDYLYCYREIYLFFSSSIQINCQRCSHSQICTCGCAFARKCWALLISILARDSCWWPSSAQSGLADWLFICLGWTLLHCCGVRMWSDPYWVLQCVFYQLWNAEVWTMV